MSTRTVAMLVFALVITGVLLWVTS